MQVFLAWCVTMRKECRLNLGIVVVRVLRLAAESNRKVSETA